LEGNVEEASSVIHGDFDLIYSFGVIHHTPSLKSALDSIASLANDRTAIKVMVYAKHSYKQAMISAGLDQPEAQSGCPIANSYSKSDIIEQFEASGLEVVKIRQAHIFPWKIDKYVAGEFEKESWWEAMPDAVFSAIGEYLGWHLLIDARLKGR
jgi:hypothetical protein